jgi:sugar phosphate isomerase/epimerase
MLNRRELLGAGVGAAVAALAHALPGDRMRYAMSGHEFRTTLPHPETGIKMTARYGYHGLEPFQDDLTKYLGRPPQELRNVLDDAGLALCTIGSGGQYLDPAKIQQTIDSNVARARYVSYFGCRHLKINLNHRVSAENLSPEHARVNLYKRLGTGGVDVTAILRILRERHYDGWVTLDFDAPRPGEGTVEQDMDRHKKYLLETLHANLKT